MPSASKHNWGRSQIRYVLDLRIFYVEQNAVARTHRSKAYLGIDGYIVALIGLLRPALVLMRTAIGQCIDLACFVTEDPWAGNYFGILRRSQRNLYHIDTE